MIRSDEGAEAALLRATNGKSPQNDALVIAEFSRRGIPVAEIVPRQNVLTRTAWLAFSRVVRPGEVGVSLSSLKRWMVKRKVRDPATGDVQEVEVERKRYATAVVYHVSQTDTERRT